MAPSRDSRAPPSAPRLYLLGTLLLSGVAGSNFTEDLFNLPGLLNHTTALNGTSVNVTLLEDKLHHIQVEHNLTVVTEDEEGFQDWENELRPGQCHRELLSELSRGYCGQVFYGRMMDTREESWCDLEEVIRPYNDMTVCLEMSSNAVGCVYPNPIVQDLFLEIHARFFKACSRGDQDFADPPMALVLTLTLLPVCLIPPLVYMALRKGHGQK